jgi:hypothetical protein
MSDLMGRGVRGKPRPTGTRIGCPVKGCSGTMYELREGEWLTRQTRPGWKRETRECQCPNGHRQKIPLLVRVTE